MTQELHVQAVKESNRVDDALPLSTAPQNKPAATTLKPRPAGFSKMLAAAKRKLGQVKAKFRSRSSSR